MGNEIIRGMMEDERREAECIGTVGGSQGLKRSDGSGAYQDCSCDDCGRKIYEFDNRSSTIRALSDIPEQEHESNDAHLGVPSHDLFNGFRPEHDIEPFNQNYTGDTEEQQYDKFYDYLSERAKEQPGVAGQLEHSPSGDKEGFKEKDVDDGLLEDEYDGYPEADERNYLEADYYDYYDNPEANERNYLEADYYDYPENGHHDY